MKNLKIKNEALKTPLYLSQTEYTANATETIGKIYVIGTQGAAPAGTNAKAGDKVYYDGSKWTVLGKSSGNGSAYSGDVILLQPDLDTMIAKADAWSKYKAIPVFKFDNFDASKVSGVAIITSQNTNDSEGYALRGANVRVMRPGGDFVEISAWPQSTNAGGGMRLSTDGTVYAYIAGTTGNYEYMLMPIYSEAPKLTEGNMTVDYSKYSLFAAQDCNATNCLFQKTGRTLFSFDRSGARSFGVKFSSYVGGTLTFGIKLSNNYTSTVTFTINTYTPSGTTGSTQTVSLESGKSVLVKFPCSVESKIPAVLSGSDVVGSNDVVRIVSDTYSAAPTNLITADAMYLWSDVAEDPSLSNAAIRPNYHGFIYFGNNTYTKPTNFRVDSGIICLSNTVYLENMLVTEKESYESPTADSVESF